VPRQVRIGYQNDEALRSGAIYFYDRLGFRPTDGSSLSGGPDKADSSVER
jgi:hypothetical protein